MRRIRVLVYRYVLLRLFIITSVYLAVSELQADHTDQKPFDRLLIGMVCCWCATADNWTPISHTRPSALRTLHTLLHIQGGPKNLAQFLSVHLNFTKY